MNHYYEPQPLARATAEMTFERGNSDAICEAIIAVALHDPDWKWIQAVCLRFVAHENREVQGAALTAIGHIARIHGQLDLDLVVPVLRSMSHDSEVGGRALDALDDIDVFMGGNNGR